MADTMMDNLAGSMTLMQSAVEGVQNSFGKRLSPYLKTAVEGITAEMPAVEEALNNIMDVVDGKATSLKRSIKSMTGSQEWKDADFFGKVDIAWDKIIAEPFMSWAGSEGKSMLSQGSKTTTYTIKSGDTLSRIAQKKLGKASRYPEIYKLNKSKIEAAAKKHGRKSSNNGHWIYPGTKLTIPKK